MGFHLGWQVRLPAYLRWMIQSAPPHGRNEAVAFAGNRQQEPGRVRVIAQCLTRLAHRDINDSVCVDEDVVAPELSDDLVAGDQLTLSRDQQQQELKQESFHADRAALASQLEGRRV